VAPGGMESEWHEMVEGGVNYNQKVMIIMKNGVTLTAWVFKSSTNLQFHVFGRGAKKPIR
jgi:hypothetical protein